MEDNGVKEIYNTLLYIMYNIMYNVMYVNLVDDDHATKPWCAKTRVGS